ncbi:MAG: hypothetical protein AB1384_04395 [Actinomycetota bacterium]
MYKIQIVEESEERMVIRCCLYDAIISYIVILIILAGLTAAILSLISRDSYELLWLIPVTMVLLVIGAYSEGRLLNILVIDKGSRMVTLRRVGPWLPGKKITCRIDQIAELCFVHSNYSLRMDKYLIFVRVEEESILEKRWRPMLYKIVFRDLWWPVYKEMPQNILEKHRRIASYLNIPYRRRLVTPRGYKDKIEE